MKNYLLYFILLGVFSCTTNKKAITANKTDTITETVTTIEQPTLSYTDGNGNLYIIFPSQVKYEPITTARSSLGTYNGGEPKTVSINNGQYNEIIKALNQAINNLEVHIENRVKGSGLITEFTDGKKSKSYNISSESEELIVAEAFLRDLIK